MPFAIVPVRVPPSVPVPVLRPRETPVADVTLTAAPPAVWLSTVTVNEPPTIGLAGLIEVIASLVGVAAITVTTGLDAMTCSAPLVPLVLVDDVNVAAPSVESAVVGRTVTVTVSPRLQLLVLPKPGCCARLTAIVGLPWQVSAEIAT